MIGPQGRPGGSGAMGDELTNLILIAVGGLLGVAFILRASGSVAAFLTGAPQPTAGAAGGVAVFFKPGDPGGQLGADGLNPFVYWVVAALMLGALVTAGFWAWGLLRRTMRQAALDPHRQEGTATRHEIAQTASTKALMRRASTLRPTLDSPVPGDVGYRLGTAHRHEVWAYLRRYAERFDLLIMGTHGRSALERVVLGSVAERVMQGAHCATMVIRQEEAAQED